MELFKKFGNITWYTNLNHAKKSEELILYKIYNDKDYPKYNNYDAINVDKVKDIPVDYKEVMGVPISFLGKHNPKQFEIITINTMHDGTANHWVEINGKAKYSRIYIKRK